MTKTILILLLAISLPSAAHAKSTAQRDAPTVRFYTRDGKSAGSATTNGTTTKFYAPDGRLVGTATHNSGRQ